MIFTELRFVAFFALVFVLHWALPSARARKGVLLLASWAFYAAWDWRFLGLIGLSTAVDFLVGLGLARGGSPRRRRALLATSLAVNLGALGLFKYFDWFTTSGAALLTWLGLPTSPVLLDLVLPVGISFYTFQTLSYTIDVYRGELEATRSPLDFALFVAFFPQLVAGPIVRAREFLWQLRVRRRFSNVAFRQALILFLFGWVKKACVADNLAVPVDAAFAAPEEFSSLALWLAALLCFAQIYCDFSGYTDMAIASAGLLGYQLPLNFHFPLWSRSVTDFWRRWHISLSTWFRDYVYIALGGNRGGRLATWRNLWITILLCGLWHGAAWTFVVWAVIHGTAVTAEKAFGLERRLDASRAAWAWCFTLVMLSLVFFRAPDLSVAATFVGGMAGAASATAALPDWPLWTVAAVVFYGFHRLNLTARFDRRLANLEPLPFGVAYGVLFALAMPFAASDYEPFVYFQF